MNEQTSKDPIGSQRELAFLPVCPSCGRQISEATRFCPSCGAGISTPPASQVAAASPNPAVVAGERLTVPDVTAGLAENIAGLLAYFILPAIVFLLIRPFKRNHFIRFHSIQCLLIVGVLMVLQVALALLGKAMPLLVLSMYGLLILAEFMLWLLLLFKAYKHEVFKLPFVGDIAEKWAERN